MWFGGRSNVVQGGKLESVFGQYILTRSWKERRSFVLEWHDMYLVISRDNPSMFLFLD